MSPLIVVFEVGKDTQPPAPGALCPQVHLSSLIVVTGNMGIPLFRNSVLLKYTVTPNKNNEEHGHRSNKISSINNIETMVVVSHKQLHKMSGKVCVVTGGTGFVGRRLVEMLVERDAKKVISFDIVPAPEDAIDDDRVQYIVGDIRNESAVVDACKGADIVWHIAAAVGPYHPSDLYEQVNYVGSLNVLTACRRNNISKMVMSSSPSTRFDGKDIDGLAEEDLPAIPQSSYLQKYAETKAMGEKAVTDACCDTLMTVAIAPHQVYGPRDNLFLPNLLEAAGTGSLRIFGNGKNRICFSHVDNYCHGLILGERAL
jgi:nucleoside-diphosphate-sugar epimerase